MDATQLRQHVLTLRSGHAIVKEPRVGIARVAEPTLRLTHEKRHGNAGRMLRAQRSTEHVGDARQRRDLAFEALLRSSSKRTRAIDCVICKSNARLTMESWLFLFEPLRICARPLILSTHLPLFA